jgi:hypothetical protein
MAQGGGVRNCAVHIADHLPDFIRSRRADMTDKNRGKTAT